MTTNDKLSFLIVGIGVVLFTAGLILQNILIVPGLILILMGAAAYRGVK